jgi:hypothetical protein
MMEMPPLEAINAAIREEFSSTPGGNITAAEEAYRELQIL